MGKKFAELHPSMTSRERGWKEMPNPLAPQPPRRAYGHTRKHIYLQADQLLYDIDAVTGLTDRAQRQVQGAEVATSEDDKYRPMFYRWMDKYIASVERAMSAYVMKKEGVTRMDSLREWQEKEIELLMPDYWDATVYDALVQAIHQYIVDGALYEYFSITLSSKDPRTLDRKESLVEGESEIMGLANRVKPGSVRKHLSPF